MKTKIKKTILKARYVDLELQEVKEIFSTCKSEWNSYVARVYSENNVLKPAAEKTTKKCKISSENKVKPKKEQPAVIKHMYRDIAKQVHPDKTNKDEESERLMRQATRAKESGDLISLFDMCDSLGLDTPNLRDGHLKYIEKTIQTKEAEIKQMKNSDAWIWYHANDKVKAKIKQMLIDSLTK